MMNDIESKTRENVRLSIAIVNEKYPKMPLLKWQDFEDAIVAVTKDVGRDLIKTLEERKQILEAKYWEGRSTHGGQNVRPLSIPRQLLLSRINEIDEFILFLKGENSEYST